MATTHLLTAEDLWALGDDGHRYDLIQGELHRMAPAGGQHGEIGMELARRIANHVVERRLGKTYGADTGFVLRRNPDTVLSPDVAFIRIARLPPAEQRVGFLSLAPDLAVEVVSPSDRPHALGEKVRIYLSAGVQMVWVVEPRPRTVVIHAQSQPPRVLSGEDDLDGGNVLPGFQLPVAEIFG